MKTLIDLSTTILDFPSVVQTTNETISLLNKEKTGLVRFPHACTVLVGWNAITDERWKSDIAETLHLETTPSPIFTAPANWRMPHVLKALGAFKSNGDAAKNGWNKDVEEGLHEHQCRIAHIKLSFSTYKVPRVICAPGSWERCDE
jgi:hypothetical protein